MLSLQLNSLYRFRTVTSVNQRECPETNLYLSVIINQLLKPEDISHTYVRIECQCWDTDDKDQPVPIELKSETFRPLKEALGK